MARLSQRDLEAVIQAVGRIHGVQTPEQFGQEVVAAINPLVPNSLSVLNVVDPAGPRVFMVGHPAEMITPDRVQRLTEHLHEHPIWRYSRRSGDGQALTISDFLSPAAYEGSDLYQQVYREIDTLDQIAISFSSAQLTLALAMNRDRRSFTERDRLVLNLLRPHLVQAYHNALALTVARAALDASGQAVIALGQDGRVLSLDEGAWVMLRAYFGDSPSRGCELPDALLRWVRAHLASIETLGSGATDTVAFHVTLGSKRLTVRCVPAPQGSGCLLTLQEAALPTGESIARQLGLTRREAEVLALAADGRTDQAIANELAVSVFTVRNQMRRIFSKLSVHNRSAAIAIVYRDRV